MEIVVEAQDVGVPERKKILIECYWERERKQKITLTKKWSKWKKEKGQEVEDEQKYFSVVIHVKY